MNVGSVDSSRQALQASNAQQQRQVQPEPPKREEQQQAARQTVKEPGKGNNIDTFA
ncbi:hypothetical protein [Chitinimonas sp.]|uniref:hypothetical protein n=1 Tax=Chitinimonas sp. TaxID=1934313 RepID=UPI002F93A971